MTTLIEIEAAAAALPFEEQRKLFEWLKPRVAREADLQPQRHSLLDIKPVSLGRVIDESSNDRDLLGEMLEDRH